MCLVTPALKCWAILGRPLRGLFSRFFIPTRNADPLPSGAVVGATFDLDIAGSPQHTIASLLYG